MSVKACTSTTSLLGLPNRNRTGLSAARFAQPAPQRHLTTPQPGAKLAQAGRKLPPGRFLTVCAATGPQYSAELESFLAPDLCSHEAFTALLQEAGPSGRLLLCRLRGLKMDSGYFTPTRRVALELVRALDGCPLPVWSSGWEAVEVPQDSIGERWWKQPLIPVLWSPDRGIIRGLPAAPIQPITSDLDHRDIETFMSTLLFGKTPLSMISILRDGIDYEYLDLDETRYSLDMVVVPDEGVPVRLHLQMSSYPGAYYKVLHLTPPLTVRQLLQAMFDFLSQPLGEDGLVEALVFMGSEWIDIARDPLQWVKAPDRGLNVEWLRQLTWYDTTGEQWISRDFGRDGPGHYTQDFGFE